MAAADLHVPEVDGLAAKAPEYTLAQMVRYTLGLGT